MKLTTGILAAVITMTAAAGAQAPGAQASNKTNPVLAQNSPQTVKLASAAPAAVVKPATPSAKPATAQTKPTPPASSHNNELQGVNVKHSGDDVQIEIKSRESVTPKVSKLSSPARVLVELPATVMETTQSKVPVGSNGIKGVRIGMDGKTPPTTSVVVDLEQQCAYELTPGPGNSFVLTLHTNSAAAKNAPAPAPAKSTTAKATPAAPVTTAKVTPAPAPGKTPAAKPAPTPAPTNTATAKAPASAPAKAPTAKAPVAAPITIQSAQKSSPAQAPAAATAKPHDAFMPKPAPAPAVTAKVAPTPTGKIVATPSTPAPAAKIAANEKTGKPAESIKAANPEMTKTAAEAKPAEAPKPKPEEKKWAMNGKRDPFFSPVVEQPTGSGCSTGKKCLDVGEINLRGVVKSEGGFIAVVTNSANKAYFLHENDPVFNGYVMKITGDSVVFQQTVEDKLGKPFTKEIVKRITTPAV